MKRALLKYSAALVVLTLVGCSGAPVSNDAPAPSAQSDDENLKPASGEEVSLNQPVVIPPGFNDRPAMPGETGAQDLPNGLPALSPAKGLKIDTLFSENVKDTKQRFQRIENAHIEFRKEYEQIKPAIVRLAAIEADLQALMSELNGFVGSQSAQDIKPVPAVPAQPAPEENLDISETEASKAPSAAPEQIVNNDNAPLQVNDMEAAPEALEKDAQPTMDAKFSLRDIRIGNHADKIRIVVETDAKIDYALDLNNEEKILTISLPDTIAISTLKRNQSFSRNALLSAYKVTEQGSGAQIILDLKKASSIKNQEVLKAKNAQSNVRLVIDLTI